MSALATLRNIANLIKNPRGTSMRMYAGARPSRLSGGYTLNSSADMELGTSLQNLRGRSRQLMRDASYARRAKAIVQNNVVGSGIGLQAQIKNTRGERNKKLNDDLESVFEEWICSDGFHTAGQLHLADMERLLIGEVMEAGEVLIRKHRGVKFGESKIPLALEVIEPELIADNLMPSPKYPGNTVRMGVEVDRFYRPVGYWLRERYMGETLIGIQHPTDRVYFVPASDMIHLRLLDRFPQTRGIPWVHTVIRRLQDIDGYSEAEIVAARAAANYFAAIKSPEDPNPSIQEKQADGSLQAGLEAGIIMKLAPGEEMEFFSPNRPNGAMDPFMRLMLREVAAGVGVSYESLSRDYSQSNYSSSRLAILDDRDLWRVLQGWFIRQFRYDLHREFMMMGAVSGEIPGLSLEVFANDMERYSAVSFKPRGWSWIDPTKEVDAYIKAVRAGFDTVSNVISKTGDGRDMEDVLTERSQELADMEEARDGDGIQFDTDPERDATGAPIGPTADQQMEVQKQAADAKAEALKQSDVADKAKGDQASAAATESAKSIANLADSIRHQKPPQALVTVEAPVIQMPGVTVKGGDVRIEPQSIVLKPSDVRVDVAPSPAPNVRVEPTTVNVAPPNVTVAAPEVRVDNHVSPTPVQVAAPNVTVDNRVDVPAPHVTVSPPTVNVEVAAPNVTVEAPDVRVENKVETPTVNVAAPEVNIDNRVSVPRIEETVQEIESDDDGNIRRVRTRTVR
jgi:lambda family phage portal protein